MAGIYLLVGFLLEKSWKNIEKLPFFRTPTDGLGKYRTGSYGCIGGWRVLLRKVS